MSRLAGPCLPPTAAMRPSTIATSPVKADLPVPSTMVPPRMTMSCMESRPLVASRNDAPAEGVGAMASGSGCCLRQRLIDRAQHLLGRKLLKTHADAVDMPLAALQHAGQAW